ncbi:hypothetical protein [Pseudomonas parafulva]|uniref:Uncharacterized protein n=1 Tax=Pseudomonas parafulva TaxID=157782 RepID=A0ABN4Y0A4_9PSED|nr:hypothetical protein [Pseudomonas parafulva]AQW68229.1 hypothetical protein B2J77_08395 [Pseudomonas parafulva]WHU44706.1 hypothetical protein OXL99_12945 [Pseudomonas fulva]
MSQFKIFFEISDGKLNIKHSIERQESEELSKFQALGLLYHMLDSAIQVSQELGQSAISVARGIFGGEGWASEVVDRLLAAQSWEERMRAAWAAVDNKAREVALRLDYNIFQNYWPNQEFCNSRRVALHCTG